MEQAQQPQQAPEQGQSEQNPLMAIKTAMDQMGQGLADKMPPEAQKALQAAIQAYNQFLSVMGMGEGSAQPEAKSSGYEDAMTAGAR